jgi:hypothetical protein
MWMITAACMSTLAAAAAIYIVILSARLERATRFAHAGMTSVGHVCGVVVNVLRSPDPPPAILRPADACLGQTASHAEAEAKNAEIDAKDYAAVADRIDAQLDDRRLPIGSIRYPEYIDHRNLPKGLREE